jgi:hypothetical protein
MNLVDNSHHCSGQFQVEKADINTSPTDDQEPATRQERTEDKQGIRRPEEPNVTSTTSFVLPTLCLKLTITIYRRQNNGEDGSNMEKGDETHFFRRINVIYMEPKEYGWFYLLNLIRMLAFIVTSQAFSSLVGNGREDWSDNRSSAQCCHCGWRRRHSPTCPFGTNTDRIGACTILSFRHEHRPY